MNSEIRLQDGRLPAISWPLLQSSLWLRGGVVGAGVALLGIMMLATGDANLALALLLFVGGGLFGGYALRRSWSLLEPAGKVAVVAGQPATVSPRTALSFDRSR